MEAGPRSERRQDQRDAHQAELGRAGDSAGAGRTDVRDGSAGSPLEVVTGHAPGGPPDGVLAGPLDLVPLDTSLDAGGVDPSLDADAVDPELLAAEPPAETDFRELRPASRLRAWQLLPIVAIGTLGSLMFAFPLAFEFGDGGPVVAMLGLLLTCCAAGWGLMAARRVGYGWPGLPARGSGDRPDWRFIAVYTLCAVVLALLAVWRVARLR